MACFDEAIRLEPGYAEAYYSKGTSLQNLHRYGESLACFDEAIRLEPGYAEAHKSRDDILDFYKHK